MQPIFKTNMFICRSKANLEVKVLLGRITHLLAWEMWTEFGC